MDSNKHGAMEQNEEDTLTYNLIYGMPKTELRMQSYGMRKNAKKLGFRGEVNPRPRSRSGAL